MKIFKHRNREVYIHPKYSEELINIQLYTLVDRPRLEMVWLLRDTDINLEFIPKLSIEAIETPNGYATNISIKELSFDELVNKVKDLIDNIFVLYAIHTYGYIKRLNNEEMEYALNNWRIRNKE